MSVFQALSYALYKAKATDDHSIHSPFVFDLYRDVISDRSKFYAFELVEAIRAQMLTSDKQIMVNDLGTGGRKKRERKLRIQHIARHFVKPARYGQILFRLVNHFKPDTIVELGTSLGITTSYLALPSSKANVHTIEGCPSTAAQAEQNLARIEIKNVQQHVGDFKNELPKILAEINTVDFAYVDGNHRKTPTLEYFKLLSKQASPLAVFVFDDIHYSREMEETWEIIKASDGVRISIDLFEFGIVFFKPGVTKQHYILKF